MLLHKIQLSAITLRQNQNLKTFEEYGETMLRKSFYISSEKTYNAFLYVSKLQLTVLWSFIYFHTWELAP